MKLVNIPQTQLKDVMKELVDEELFFNPEGIQLAKIELIEVLDKTNMTTKEKYEQIRVNVRTSENKSFNKVWSTDFTRKFFTQIGHKSSEMDGAVVAIKPTGRYKSIGYFAFLMEDEDTGDYHIVQYQDESLDFKSRLEKLGI